MTNYRLTAILFGIPRLTVRGDGRLPIKVNGAAREALEVRVEGIEGGTPIPDPPLILTSPEIAGYVVPGEVLTVTPGTYSGADSVSRQWQRDGFDLPGETGLTYLCVQGDVLEAITVVETAANAGGSVSQTSLPAQDAIQALRDDSTAVALFASLGDYMAETSSGSLGINPGDPIGRIEDVLYGLSLVQSGAAQRPAWNGGGRVYDSVDDRLEAFGTSLPTDLSQALTSIVSVDYLASNTNAPVWSTAFTSDALPFYRVGAGAPSLTSGASTIRATGRADNGSSRTVITNSTRNPVGAPSATPWSLRWRLSKSQGAPGTQTLTELQPDSGTNSADKFAITLQDRFCEGCSVTPSGVTGFINARVYATAYFSTDNPPALSLAAVEALFDHWSFP